MQQAEGTGFRISRAIRGMWRELENIATVAAGPLLIAASILQAADIYSNHAISAGVAWLALAWALARAVGVTIWIRPAIHYAMRARAHGGSGGGWILLTGGLFLADIQALLLYGSYTAHLTLTGALGVLDPGPYGWLVEMGVLGAVLLMVHAIVDYMDHEQGQVQQTNMVASATTRPVAPTDERMATPLPPVAANAFYAFPAQPHGITGYATSATAKPRKPRPNSGRPVESVAQRVQRMTQVMTDNPRITRNQMAELFGISPSTAQQNMQRARDIMTRERESHESQA